jgi:glycerol-3-phosphate acyltransferase PlsY
MLTFIFAAAAVYLAGSVNFSILLFRLLGRDDPRKGFSANPGTTNVYRQAGPLWALLVLFLDLGRASALAYVSLRVLPPVLLPWCAFFLLLGNIYPAFHGFKGGKGVANYLGYTLVPAPWFAAASAAAWLLLFKITLTQFSIFLSLFLFLFSSVL